MGALTRRLTLIQGPPGTGKTYTAIELLAIMVKHNVGPILATADSNVAVDNLLQGLLDKGIRAIRIGQPVKVREQLREATLAAQMAQHSMNEDIDAIFSENNEIKRSLNRLKGKEKGMAHRDMNKNWKEIRAMENQIIEELIDSAEVVVATCIGVAHRSIGDRRFPIVLIDEATQATEPATMVPIIRGARQLILIGDHKQLPPTIISKRAEDAGLVRSLFERLVDAGIAPFVLRTQYRMHPCISEFPSARFYEGLLENGVSAEERPTPAGFIWPNWDLPIAFIPIESIEGTDVENASRYNLDEAAKVVEIVQKLLETKDILPNEIGVITPYNGQVRLLTDHFDRLGGIGKDEPFSGLEIRSVDGYQGREKEIIIFSTVRANDQGELGFLTDKRRLNVALTRAKRGLIIVGNPQTLRRDETWKSWLEWIEERELMAWHYR
jgi:regulator of nonsense transcripts 1